jgi:hypothetical protein
MRSRTTGLTLFLFGIALLAWLLYDATGVQAALGLTGRVSEAVVVIVGLLVVAASLSAGIVCWFTARRAGNCA